MWPVSCEYQELVAGVGSKGSVENFAVIVGVGTVLGQLMSELNYSAPSWCYSSWS